MLLPTDVKRGVLLSCIGFMFGWGGCFGGGGRVLVEIFTCFSVHWAAFDTLGLEKRCISWETCADLDRSMGIGRCAALMLDVGKEGAEGNSGRLSVSRRKYGYCSKDECHT
jgi:hypothetical protein